MGAGSSLEAAYTLQGPIDAGEWRLVADGIVLDPVDVTFEILWRSDDGDEVIASFQQHFEPLPNDEYRAQAYEETASADEVPAAAGDELVLRFTAGDSDSEMSYIPNGDGMGADGRIPFIELPE